jgi:hypothetical protein
LKGSSVVKTWRTSNLKPAVEYRVEKSIVSPTDSFEAGEFVTFLSAEYSRYDSSTAYVFRSRTTGKTKTWFLADKDADVMKDLFKECS